MSHIEIYKNKGLTGLVNLGNTCYINSSLQIISNIPELNEYINEFVKSTEFNNNDINMTFLKEWIDLYNLMWSRNVTISPNRFIRAIFGISKKSNNDLFTDFQQNDTTEFIYFIINIFHEALKNKSKDVYNNKIKILQSNNFNKKFINYFKSYHKNNYSIIDRILGHYCKVDYIDEDTQELLSTTYENNYIISLPLVDTSLTKCIDSYFKNENLNEENNNQYFYDKDNTYRNVIKKTSIY